jgi:hypothetical protein
MAIWPVVMAHVAIRQKVRQHRPLDKLLDCLINILAGGSGLVEINTRVRPDHALQLAFGRSTCAEQSTISETLNACTSDNVAQLRTAIKLILRQHGQCYHHNYQQDWQLLDVDMTGLSAGRLGEGVSKGYFAGERNRRGRQLGRVLASWYDEIVVDRLYDGKRQLNDCLQELILLTEDSLELDEARRRRTIVRCDGGGGEDDDVNWLLKRHYYLLVKIKNWRRASKLAASVARWYTDPKMADREVGWVETPHAYAQPTRQLALRKGKKDGTWSYHALVFNLTDEMLDRLTAEPQPADHKAETVLFAAVHAYDRRGGGVETQNRGDKQGLGLARRNKHKFAAQEMLVLLAQLAHNLVVWTRDDLAEIDPRFHKYGIQRTVRDALQIPGTIQINADGQIQGIALNERHPLTPAFCHAFATALSGDDLSPILGKN